MKTYQNKLDKTLIIAEVGVNHNGDINKAMSLALKAKNIGANLIKFQLYDTDLIASKDADLCNYQKKNTKEFKSQYELLKKYEISFIDAERIINFCIKNKIEISFSCFDEKSIKIFKNSYIKYIKIPSGEITNHILLEKVSKFNKKIILSTGNASIFEIKSAIQILNKYSKKNITLLHCVSDYPTKIEDINLKTISYLNKKFKLKVGLSDHTTSEDIPSYAVALGATMIEKHITNNVRDNGPDHKASLNIPSFKRMIINIRKTEKILGIEDKILTSGEKKNKKLVRRYLIAKKEINIGDKFSKFNLTTRRTGKGLEANSFFKIIGHRSKYFFKVGDLIRV